MLMFIMELRRGDRGGEKGLEALGIFLENPKSLVGPEELLLKP